jgi:hypothetical protein|tara:strand:- start:459 stop:602 length:144 start_codon:yes stop_codon:yes gene_type:complete
MGEYSFEDLASRSAQDFPNPDHVATDCAEDDEGSVQTTLIRRQQEGE